MTAASATPQQMRDRLLQAIDGQSNIRNMVAVLEVISYLEKYPITKEALEETRLGKLINDVRKKTKDEDLAKRAKKLLRNWQKLIEPGQSEVLSKGIPGAPGAPGSANGKTYPCRTEISPPAFTPTSKPVSELKCKNDIYNSRSPKTEKSSNRKRKGDQKDGLCLPTKISKTSAFERIQTATPSATNGIGSSAEPLSNSLDANLHSPLDRGRTEPTDNDKHSKIPVNAVKPHPSVPGLVKLPRTSSLLKTAVVQQHIMDEVTVEGGVPYPPKSPRCSSFSPRSMKQQALTNHPTTYAPKETVSSPYQSSRFPDGCASVPPSLPSPQPLVPPVEMSRADGPQFPKPKSSLISQGPAQVDQHVLQSTKAVESLQDSTCSSKLSACSLSTTPHEQGCSSEVAKVESDGAVSSSEGKRRKKYRPRDYTVNLIGQPTEDRTKPVRLKDRRLTFDPVTGQIKPLTHKEPYQEEEPVGPSSLGTHRTDLLKQKTVVPVQSPFQQTNWKELSRNEIIQSYLNLQSNVLTSSGAQTPGAQFFMKEYLKREEHHIKESRKTHVLVPNSAETDLPGVNREVTLEDLHRIHKEHWPGVNGCYDTKDNWFDWTQCISLDPHGDESKLNVLPYACLD